MPSILHRARRTLRRSPTAQRPTAARDQVQAHSDVWLSAVGQARVVGLFVALAVVARTVRFALRFPLWEDECFLVSNFIHRDFADLLEPLNYHQVAPLGFLAAELSAVKLLGFNEWSLRLLPFACGIAGIFLFCRLAVRLLDGSARTIAIATFCASYSGIRYAAEAKPYGVDLFVSLTLLTLAVEWRHSRRGFWLILLTAAVPAAVVVSYPALFVAGGISLFLAWELCCRHQIVHATANDPSEVAGAKLAAFDSQCQTAPSASDAPAGANTGAPLAGGAHWYRRASARPALPQPPMAIARTRRDWFAWAAFNGVLVTSFWLMLRFAIQGQAEAELGWMQDYWKDQLPSPLAPGKFLFWLLSTHTGNLLAIPAGGQRGASTLSFLLVVSGVIALCRTRRFGLAILCLSPAALNLLAAFMGRYPYGGHVKFSQYLAPAICSLIGVGGAALISAGRVDRAGRRRRLAAGLAVLALIPLGTIARDFASPYKSQTDARYRDFARWFWPSLEFGGEAACLQTDLGQEFAPGTFHHLGWSAMYLCNQRIYSPRHRLGQPVDWSRISANWPLHCVEYRAEVYKYNDSACQDWLDEMNKRYRLVSRDVFPSPVFDQRGHHLLCADRLVIYKFIPR